jgi:CRP/FNR family nitrogen fixation transcriptional regulator
MPSTLSYARHDAAKALPALTGEAPASLTDYLRRIQDFGSRLHFQRNEIIFSQDDAAENFYRIVSGTVRLCRYMPDGRRYIVDFHLPGDIIGLTESPDHPVCAEAVSDVILVAYPRACFDRLAKECPELRARHLCHLSAGLLTAQQHLFVLGCQKAKERLASFLLRLADRMDLCHGDRLDLPMGRQDIADHLGLTIETISRSLSLLRAEGAILVPNTHQLVLRDMTILRALAAED